MKLSIIIPVYNEKFTVDRIVEKVKEISLGDMQKEIIIVNDGSNDGTGGILKKYSLDKEIRIYDSKINLGKGAAIRIGLTFVTGDIVLFQDADLELMPQEPVYGSLIKPIQEGGADVVYGSRFLNSINKKNISFKIKFANALLTLLTNLLYRVNLTDMETGYKVFRADVIKKLQLKSLDFNIEPEITVKLIKSGYKIEEIPVVYQPRTIEEGKKINWKDGLKAIWVLVKYKLY